jgi:5-methylcytosine-specific restriction endonuclease McrBC GTP-binding regulatory subunit McrB
MNIWLCKDNEATNVIVRIQALVDLSVGILEKDIIFVYTDDYTAGSFFIKKRYTIDDTFHLTNEEEITSEIDFPYSILYKTKSKKDLIKLTQKEKEFILTDKLFINLSLSIPEPHNKIVYGAPGTGKSHLLEEKVSRFFSPFNWDRVTFYSGYTYGQFIGTFKPKTIYKEVSTGIIHHNQINPITNDHEPIIIYEFVAGPFIELLVKALSNASSTYCLIIEEINRTKVDAVFGNIFQLLDRKDNGKSKYTITPSLELQAYLNKYLPANISSDINENGLYLPSNFYLWATMNSADQGVFPIDTAFKRRWDFEYISLNENEISMNNLDINLGNNDYIAYNTFRKVINKLLISNYNINEDRLIAPFFIKISDFKNNGRHHNLVLDEKVFTNKIVMYLKDDILRHVKNEKIFEFDTFSEIIEKYPSSRIIDKSIIFL